jgi:FtsH-binding integral membrane protein
MMWRKLRVDQQIVVRRLARRAIILCTSGLIWLGMGLTTLIEPNPRFGSLTNVHDGLRILDESWPGFIWVITGLVALVVGIFHNRKVLEGHDAIGFNAILLGPILHFIGACVSLVSAILTEGHHGRYLSVYSVFVWFLIVLFIMTIAGWPEPPQADTTPEGRPPHG